ncbi:MAG: hypothetical protein QGG40_16270, partial [Myxococcota bacterium]|nr:hypothetical protein [Myxococcota bacterium]
LLHPDARAHHAVFQQALGARCLRAGSDAWLLPADLVHSLGPTLCELAREGIPPRHQIRGSIATGPGRWSRGAVLGPTAIQAIDAARARPWGEVDGLLELPPPLPPPPPATRWWAGAAACGIAATLAGLSLIGRGDAAVSCPIEANFSIDSDQVHARFDTHDLAIIDVVSLSRGILQVHSQGVSAGKGAWATGEGDYLLQVQGRRIALISSLQGIVDLERMVQAAQNDPDPLESLRERVRATVASADVALSPVPGS